MRHAIKYFGFALVSLASVACSDVSTGSEEPVDEAVGPVTFGSCGSNCSSWAYPSFASGFLVYAPDHEGDRIPEFARIGYKKSRGGTLRNLVGGLPPLGPRHDYAGAPPRTDVNVLADVICRTFPFEAPVPFYHHGDDIQAALDAIADDAPNVEGVRGHLHLPRGHYAVWNRLVVPDGVVLVGQSENTWNNQPATTLHACGSSSTALITITEEPGSVPEFPKCEILDEVVPVGSTSVVIPTSCLFGRGSLVKITRYATKLGSPATWFADLGMTNTWTEPPVPGGACALGGSTSCFSGDIEFEREVTHVEPAFDRPNAFRVFFEHPLTNALERKYGPHTIEPLSPPNRARNSGVYNLRGTTHLFDATTQLTVDPCPAGHDCGQSGRLLLVRNAIDSWAKELIGEQFPRGTIQIGSGARQVTVEDVISVGLSGTGGGQSYSYELRGHMNLYVNAYAENGRHDLMTQNGSSGPCAFVDSTAVAARSDSGTHHDWSIGTLLDRVSLQGDGGHEGRIIAANRTFSDMNGNLETGSGFDSHGWTGANLVVWNSNAEGYEYFNPPGAQNWLIGSTGDRSDLPNQNEYEDPPADLAFDVLRESPAHYDFEDPAEHGTPASLAPLSFESNPSLFRVSNAQWRTFGHEFETRHYFVGDPDQAGSGDIGTAVPDLATGVDNNDIVYVNPLFSARVQSWFGGGVAGFDNLAGDHNIPFTVRYQLEPGEQIVGAYLAMRIERTTWTSDAYHHVTLASRDFDLQRETLYWRCNGVSPCVQIPAFMTGPLGWSTSPTYPVLRVLDLSEEPYLTYLRNVDPSGIGELNVNFFKRTRVDWAALTLIVQRG